MEETTSRIKRGVLLGMAWSLPTTMLLILETYFLAHDTTYFTMPPIPAEEVYLPIGFIPLTLFVSAVIAIPNKFAPSIMLGIFAMTIAIEISIVGYFAILCSGDYPECRPLAYMDNFTDKFSSAIFLASLFAICLRVSLDLVGYKLKAFILAFIFAIMARSVFGVFPSFAYGLSES